MQLQILVSMRKIFLLLNILMLTTFKAQHETAIWFSSQFPIKISKNLELHNDVGFRLKGDHLEFNQHLYRTGIRYYFNKNINSAVGVALFFTDNNLSSDTKVFGTEFRFWEEVVYQKSFKTWKTVFRFRPEERFFDEYGNKASYIAFRTRFLMQLNKKINEIFTFQVANEYLYQFKNGTSGLDQNRIMANIFYYPAKNWEIKAGYMEVVLQNNKYTDTMVFGISKKL